MKMVLEYSDLSSNMRARGNNNGVGQNHNVQTFYRENEII